MSTTKISWTETTWNPVTGCSKISKGCTNCYAALTADRLKTMVRFVNVSNRPITASDLNVFLVYEKTGRKYQIFRGQGMTDEILRNLNIEHMLYEEGEYPYRVSTILADSNQNAYQAILSTSQKGYTKLRKLSWNIRSVAPHFRHNTVRVQLPDN